MYFIPQKFDHYGEKLCLILGNVIYVSLPLAEKDYYTGLKRLDGVQCSSEISLNRLIYI
jgi:hypothetical protein